MIAMADMDGDGKIQYNEFVTVMFNKKNWIVIQHLNLQSFSKSDCSEYNYYLNVYDLKNK